MSEQTQDQPLALDPAARWVVTATFATAYGPNERQLDKLSDAADRYDITVAARGDAESEVDAGLVFTGEVPSAEVARFAALVTRLAYETCGYTVSLPTFDLIDLHVRTPEQYEADALRPDIPELAGAADVAELLGVSRQRVHQLATENTAFPAPVARLAVGPIWTVAAIQAFDASWERRTGRPRKVAAAG